MEVSQWAEQAQTWENTFLWRIGDEGPSSSGKLCAKLPRNERNEKTLRSRGKWTKIGWIFHAAWSGITNSESIERKSTKITRTIGMYCRLNNLLWSWLTLRSSSSSFYCEFKIAQPPRWNATKTREKMSIPGNVFDCQHARRDLDELHNDSRNLAISSAILRTEALRKVRSKDHCKQYHNLAVRKEQEKKV